MDSTLVNRAFDINPTSVFGFILALLIIGMILLGYVCAKLWKTLGEERDKRETLTVNSITVITNVTNVLEEIQKIVSNLSDKVPVHLDRAEGNLKTEIGRAQTVLEKAINAIK